jgi:UDP-glucose 4-epimerase
VGIGPAPERGVTEAPMTILVTGGAGYVGSATVEHLVAKGESVVVLDDLKRGHREALMRLCRSTKVVLGTPSS